MFGEERKSESDSEGERVILPKKRKLGEVDEVQHDHFATSHRIVVEEMPEDIEKSYWDKHESTYGPGCGKRRMLRILREKLLQHKWGDAAMLMEGVANQSMRKGYDLSDVFWKVGNEVIYNHPATLDEADLVLRHRQTTQLHNTRISRLHVLYEYVLFLLVQKDFESARNTLSFFRTSIKMRGRAKLVLDREVEFWAPVLEGYLGLLDYVKWRQIKEASNSSFLLSEDDRELSVVEMTAEKAVSHFETMLVTPGVWDTFMVKNVEILEDLGRVGEAEEALRAYALTNPKNPNSHKYLLQFLLRHPETEENEVGRMDALSKLHQVAPSDELMLDLHSLRMKAALKKLAKPQEFMTMAAMALEVLMDMLDYPTWTNNSKAWSCLADSLRKVQPKNVKSFQGILEIVWYSPKRHLWWPKYHFTALKAKETLQKGVELGKAKAFIASVLVSENCEFTQYVYSQTAKNKP